MDYREYRSQYNNTPERREVNQKSAKPILYAIIALALMLCIIVGVIISSAFSRPDYVARSVTVEAGRASIEASDFLVDKSHSAEFGDGALFDLSAVGEYKIPLVVDGKNCTTKLIVIDTKAPEGIVRDMSVWHGFLSCGGTNRNGSR